MSDLYKSKLSKSINNLPHQLQSDYKLALKKHIFNLEIYVPQNNISKKTNAVPASSSTLNANTNANASTNANINANASKSSRIYLRNKLVDFDDNYREEKEYLDNIKKETKDFSNQYKELNKEDSSGDPDSKNKAITKHFKETYGKSIEVYKDKGYNEDKLFPKRNIFESSILLEETNKFNSILKTVDEKMIKKEERFIRRIHNDVLKLNKGMSSIETGKKRATEPSLTILPSIKQSARSLKVDNLLLNYDILRTEKTLNDMLSSSRNPNDDNGINNGNGNSNVQLNRTTVNDSNRNNVCNVCNDNNKPYEHQEELFISSKGMKVLIKPKKQKTIEAEESLKKDNNDNDNEAKAKAKVAIAQAGIMKKKENKKLISINKGRRQQQQIKVNKSQQQSDLFNLYETIQKGNYEKEIPHVRTYINKYKKKKVEPIIIDNGSNLHGLLYDCLNKIAISNLPELTHKLQSKHADRYISEDKLDHVAQLDTKLKVVEKENITELLMK